MQTLHGLTYEGARLNDSKMDGQYSDTIWWIEVLHLLRRLNWDLKVISFRVIFSVPYSHDASDCELFFS